MPAQPISDRVLKEAVAAVKKHGSVTKAARALGLNRTTLSSRVGVARDRKGKVRVEPKEFDVEIGAERYIITAAQNATPLNKKFWASLQEAAQRLSAQLIVVPIRYKNPTSHWTASQDNEEVWDPLLAPYLCNQRKRLHKHLVLLGDVKTVPTAEQPLTGFETMTHNESAILGHTRLQFKTVPTPRHSMPKILTTTGAVTVPNYTDTKLGKKGEFHHTQGACLVEIDGDTFHLRQLNAVSDGSFIDLDVEYLPTGWRKAPPASALVLGDTHVDFTDPAVDVATFGRDGMVGALAPQNIVFNDLLDGYSRNPHHRGNVFNEIAKRSNRRHCVASEVARAAQFLRNRQRKGSRLVVVSSNHDDFLARWIRDTDWRFDPDNASFYLETAKVMVDATRMGRGGMETIEPFSYWLKKLCEGVDLKCLRRDESFEVNKIELGFHGDRGPNGARGSLKNFRAIGPRVVIGHCLTGDHDVLTRSLGWQPIASVPAGGEVLSWRAGRNEWQATTEKQQYEYSGRLVRIRHDGAFDQEVTPNHKLMLSDGRAVNVCDAILTESAANLPIAALPAAGSLVVEERTIRMVVAVCADGSFDNGQCTFNLKKARKVERLQALFGDALNPARKISKNGASKRSLKTKSREHAAVAAWVCPINKRLPQAWINLTPECREIFLDELRHWDGNFLKPRAGNQFSTFKGDEASLVAGIITAHGLRCTMAKRPDSRGYVISWCDDRDYSFVTAKGTDKVRIGAWGASTREVVAEPVYCFTLPNGCFWVRSRRTGLVSLTHNSHSPGIEQGAYQTGTSTYLTLEYTSGPSSWLQTHCVVYANGKRALLSVINGKWRKKR